MFSLFFVPRQKHTPNFSGEIIEIIEIENQLKAYTNGLRYPPKTNNTKEQEKSKPYRTIRGSGDRFTEPVFWQQKWVRKPVSMIQGCRRKILITSIKILNIWLYNVSCGNFACKL